MKTRSLISLLLLALLATNTNAEWRLLSTEEAAATPSGRHLHVVARESDSGDRVQLHFAIFDSRKVTLRIIDQPNERGDLADAMAAGPYLAGVNGGYFESDYEPVGLLISGGRAIAPFRRARLLSGVLSVANGRVRLQCANEFSMKGKITEAVQCGPFLIDHGRAVAGLDESHSARRTFVAIGNGEAIALGYASSISLAQLAHVLAIGKIAGDFRIQRAMNLDGASSSAFWFKDGSAPFSISEQKTVRDFVGICPR